jgi:hypothetical protein
MSCLSVCIGAADEVEAVVVIESEREERRREKVRMIEEGVERMSRSKIQRDRRLVYQI